MGYSFTIGESILSNDPELDGCERIAIGVCLDSAPSFINDEYTGKTNTRSPSYTVWDNFTRATGLYSFFYNPDGRMKGGHPGYFIITQADVDRVKDALDKYKAKATLPPGFESYDYEGPDNYDYHLARLIWLEFWMRWAVDNSKCPIIQNC